MTAIDVNCDMGESPGAVVDGSQERLMQHITSVNIACGGHAGDGDTMRGTVMQALVHELGLGAHPGYPDRQNFGRVEMAIPLDELSDSIAAQVAKLAEIASRAGVRLTHVKPHGALYNQAARDARLARAIAEGVRRVDHKLILVGLAGLQMLDCFRDAGFAIAAEAFCDRAYEPDGSLRARRHADALIRDPERAAAQALRIAQHGMVTAWNGAEIAIEAATLCIHSDTAGACEIASAVARTLSRCGIVMKRLEAVESGGDRT